MKIVEERYECDVCNSDDWFKSEVTEILIKIKYPSCKEELVYKKHLCMDCMAKFEEDFDL